LPEILFVATEWDSKKGGISTFNIQLASECAAVGRYKVVCAVPLPSREAIEEAQSRGVMLVGARVFSGDKNDPASTATSFFSGLNVQ
jgi:hypothetical protein